MALMFSASLVHIRLEHLSFQLERTSFLCSHVSYGFVLYRLTLHNRSCNVVSPQKCTPILLIPNSVRFGFPRRARRHKTVSCVFTVHHRLGRECTRVAAVATPQVRDSHANPVGLVCMLHLPAVAKRIFENCDFEVDLFQVEPRPSGAAAGAGVRFIFSGLTKFVKKQSIRIRETTRPFACLFSH